MKKNNLKKALIVPLISFFLVFLLMFALLKMNGFAPFGNSSFTWGDANIQYIDFLGYAKNILLGNDSLNYSYNIGLGSSGFGLFCYYLSSPFNLLLLFANSSNIYTLFDIIIVLKLSFASLIFSIYLTKRFNKKVDNKFNILLSVSYALMQYTIAQCSNIMWLDGIYMLPLILLGVHKLVNENKFTLLSVSVALSILFNWYTGGINCLFSIFWFIVEYLLANKNILKKENIGKLINKTILYGMSMGIGVIISAILFLPNVIQLRSGTGTFDLSSLNFNMNGNLLTTIHYYILGSTSDKGSLSIFCGSFVLIGLISFFLSKENKRNKIILLVTLITSLLFCYWQPFLYVFSLLKTVYTYWYRFSYVVIFVPIFIAALYFSKLNIKNNKYYIYISIVYAVIIGLLNYANPIFSNNIIFYSICFNFIIALLLYFNKKSKNIWLLLMFVVCVEVGCNASLLMNQYKIVNVNSYVKYINNQENLIDKLKDNNGVYRILELNSKINYENNSELNANLNESLYYNYMSMKSYTSAPSNNELSFLNNMGHRMEGERMNLTDSPILATDSFLGVRYFVSPYEIPELKKVNGLSGNGNNVYENEYYFPLAMLYDNNKKIEYKDPFQYQNEVFSNIYGKEVDLYKRIDYTKEKLGENNYKYNLAVPNGNYTVYSYIPWYAFSDSVINLNSVYHKQYSKWLANNIYYVPKNGNEYYVQLSSDNKLTIMEESFYVLDLDLLKKIQSEIINRKINAFEIKGNKINIKINDNTKNNLLVTLSNVKGWKVKVNGKKTNISSFADNLINIEVPNGNVNVELTYITPGLIAGSILSVMGVILLVLLNLIYKRFDILDVIMERIIKLYKKYEEIINYLIVGVLTTIVSLVVKWGLLFTIFNANNALQLQISVVISWIAAVMFAYVTNRMFVFKSKNKNILRELINFFGARLLTLIMEMVIMWFFVTLLGLNTDQWVLIWTVVAQVLITIFNYLFSKIFVFKK